MDRAENWREMTLTQWITTASVAAVVVSVLAIAAGLKGVRDQLRVTVFLTYTERYARIMNSIPFEARQPDSSYRLASRPEKERIRVLAAFREYFNLCSEEKWLHEHRKIDRATWEIWVRGMQVVAQFACFRDCWEFLVFEYDGYDKFQNFVEATLLSGATASSQGGQSALGTEAATTGRSGSAAGAVAKNQHEPVSTLLKVATPQRSSPPHLRTSSLSDKLRASTPGPSYLHRTRRLTRRTATEVSALRAKLDHVKSCLVRLDESVTHFYASKPYTITVESNSTALKHTAYIAFTKPPPQAFGLQIGDIVHNLRSVLDDAARLLVPGIPDNFAAAKFLTCNDPVQYYHGIDGEPPLAEKVQAISDPHARAFIERLQPFRRHAKRGLHDDLWVLDQLFIINKHRRLLLTQASTHGSRLRFLGPGNDRCRVVFKVGTLRPGDKSRAKLATMFSDMPQPRVEVEFELALTIAFDEREIARSRFVRKTLTSSWLATAHVADYL